MNYVMACYRVYGSYAKALKKYFIDIKSDLQRADLRYTLEEYLSVAMLTATITFFIETVLFSFIFSFFTDVIMAVFAALLLSVVITASLLFIFYSYPATKAGGRAKEISKVLPFAVSYMTSLASGKMQPAEMFKMLSQFDEYGEVAKECDDIAKNIELFGMSVSSAIRKEAERTPSHEFKDVLYGINTTMSAGGDLSVYLREKTDALMSAYSRALAKYSQDLSLFVEIYLTLIIAGSIFFIVLSSVMSVISGGLSVALIQTFVVFVLLPLISIGFIVLIKTLSPVE